MSARTTAELVVELRRCVDGSDSSHDTSMWLLRESADRLCELMIEVGRLQSMNGDLAHDIRRNQRMLGQR